MIAAIILAGGIGSRVGEDRPKQFIEVNDKPIIVYTTEIYQKHPQVDAIEIVCHKQWIPYTKEMIEKYSLTKVKWMTDGGETFQESVMNGMSNLMNKLAPDDMVMIHYAAAPFTSQEIVTSAIEVCKKHGMSVSCTPCYQLMGSNDKGGISNKWVDRDKVIQLACPQSFRFGYLIDIYERAKRKELLEKVEPHTTSLMYALGDTLYQSYGNQTNIKITTKEDLEMFEGCLIKRC